MPEQSLRAGLAPPHILTRISMLLVLTVPPSSGHRMIVRQHRALGPALLSYASRWRAAIAHTRPVHRSSQQNAPPGTRRRWGSKLRPLGEGCRLTTTDLLAMRLLFDPATRPSS